MDIIKFVVIILYIYFIGYCVVNLLIRKPEQKISIYSFIGLIGIVGIGIASIELLLFPFLKLSWNIVFLAIPWLVIFSLLLIRKQAKPKINHPTFKNYLIVLFLILLTLSLVGWILINPVVLCDGWAIWNFKAQVFYLRGSIPLDFLLNPNISFAHMDYVLLLPLSQAWIYIHLGHIQTEYSQIIYIILYWSMLLIVLDFFKSISKKKIIPLILVILLALTPWLIEQAQYNCADIIVGVYSACGLAYMVRWLRGGGSHFLYFATLLFGFGAFTKNEGIFIYEVVLVFLFFYMVVIKKRGIASLLKEIVLPVVLSLAPILLWNNFTNRHAIFGDSPGTNINISFTLANFNRLPYILQQLFKEGIIHYAFWGVVWWLFVGMFIVALINKLESAKYYIILFLMLIIYIALYYYNVHDLKWVMSGSLHRLLVQIVPIAIMLVGFTILEIWDQSCQKEQK